ncbi:MAG: hypothetical protein L0I84_05880, partial [Halomonas subglaciescola]|nr:hypothetical protein [Halomonas subglaciescola]
GLLGIAGMQVKALQGATIGYQHTLVTLAAIDAQERIWDDFASRDTCDEVDVATVSKLWKDHWKNDKASNPLRGVKWSTSSLQRASGNEGDTACEFTVEIALGDGPGGLDEDADVYDYTFMLPPKLNFSD